MSSISPLLPVMQRIDRLVCAMVRNPLNHTAPFHLMTQLAPGNFSLHISWLQRLHHVRQSMLNVALLREIQRSGADYQGNPIAEFVLESDSAGGFRMGLMEALMALCDMAAPCGGDIHTLVEWLNGHLDRLEALWEDHQIWLEHQHMLEAVRQYLGIVPERASSTQLLNVEDGSGVSTEDDEEVGDPLLRLRSIAVENFLVGEETPLFCICGQCGPNDNPGDCFAP